MDFWLSQLEEKQAEKIILSPTDIEALNASYRIPRENFYPQIDLLAPLDPVEFADKVNARLAWLHDKYTTGQFLERDGSAIQQNVLENPFSPSRVQPKLHIALENIQVHCAPRVRPFFAQGANTHISRNACSTVRAQEALQVVAEWPGGMKLVRVRYTMGWIKGDAPLSPLVEKSIQDAIVHGPFASVISGDLMLDMDGVAVSIPERTRLPLVGTQGTQVYLATKRGVQISQVPKGQMRSATRSLTRRAVLEEAFYYVDSPYGFGGMDGGRDCSRLQLDIFESFGLHLPRHSTWQAEAGSYVFDVRSSSEAERVRLMDSALDRGIVLLRLPGHILLYLGRNESGQPMALHALGEYMQPCTGGGETLVHVDRVQVSDLELGRNTSRKAFMERITHVVVLGNSMRPEWADAAAMRPAAPVSRPNGECKKFDSASIFVSPRRPNAKASLRVVATVSGKTRPIGITLEDPKGKRHHPSTVTMYGPPPKLLCIDIFSPAGEMESLSRRRGPRRRMFGSASTCSRKNKLNKKDRRADLESPPSLE